MTPSLFHDERADPVASYVRVAVDRAGVDVAGGLTYAAPESVGDVRLGDLVQAPLGRGSTTVPGFVVEIDVAPELDPARIKRLKRVSGVRLPVSVIELARWISDYYCCPLGTTLAAIAPAGVKRRVGAFRRTLVTRAPRPGAPTKLGPGTTAAWARILVLPDSAFPVEARALADLIDERTVGPINRLVRAGLLEEIIRREVRAPELLREVELPMPITLTDEQRRATERISETFGRFAMHVLHGVTGSGKTEVYLQLVERALGRGLGAIILTPEIGLTPQTAGRMLGRFGAERVAVMHSSLSAGQRHQAWARVAAGEAKVVIGPRSAVFAPFGGEASAPLGLVVVDEEHDAAYKQSQAPRHHGRDVAVKRAQLSECPVVMGSATPSLEAWRHTKGGRATLHTLTTRPAGAQLPSVRVIDLIEERRTRPWREAAVSLIGPTMERAIRETLDAGDQVMLLLNRRGFATYLCCREARCGWSMRCRDCDATMVFHTSRGRAPASFTKCHHCLAELRTPPACPDCRGPIERFGVGAQRVEQELASRFPDLIPGETMLRVDSDAVRGERAWRATLGRFARREARALLGTQMIAKGLDFPGVALVGVLNADTAVDVADFRSEERTFQLVSQVAGRAGRTSRTLGHVLIQTMRPEAPSIVRAAAHDYVGFADEELAVRQSQGLPPFRRLARVIVKREALESALAHAERLATGFRASRGLEVLGPAPCRLARIAGLHRVGMELLGSAGAIHTALADARAEGLVGRDPSVIVDVDAIDLS